MRVAINAAILSDEGVLLVKKRDTWIFPGGKMEAGEGDSGCLRREVRQELSGTEIEIPKYYRGFEGRTPHRGDILKARVYFAKVKGKLGGPSAEIRESRYFKSRDGHNLSDISAKIFDSLVSDGYLNAA